MPAHKLTFRPAVSVGLRPPSGEVPVEFQLQGLYTIRLKPESGEIPLRVSIGGRGPRGEPGQAASKYQHTQVGAADTWVINHNFGYYPQVQVFSPGWVELDALILNLNINQTQVQFNSAQSGFAICQ